MYIYIYINVSYVYAILRLHYVIFHYCIILYFQGLEDRHAAHAPHHGGAGGPLRTLFQIILLL